MPLVFKFSDLNWRFLKFVFAFFPSVSDFSVYSMDADGPSGSRFRELTSSSEDVCFRSRSPSSSRTSSRSRGGCIVAVEEARLLLEANVIKFCDTGWICFLLPAQSADWSPGL